MLDMQQAYPCEVLEVREVGGIMWLAVNELKPGQPAAALQGKRRQRAGGIMGDGCAEASAPTNNATFF